MNVPSGKNTSTRPCRAAAITVWASARLSTTLYRSTNNVPNRRSTGPATICPASSLLGNKGRLAGQYRRKHQRVDIARMVEHKHGVTARNPLDALDRNRSTDGAEGRARDRSQHGPAPRETREDQNGQPSDQES